MNSTGLVDLALSFVPLLVTAVVAAFVLRAAQWWLLDRHPSLGNERRLPRQLAMLGLTLATVAALVLALPLATSSRNQMLGLMGLLVSGLFAFSSTTIVANLMAGLMLRVTKPFRAGDFIRVGEHFGRVSERGLLETEVQTEWRDLIAFPNTYLIANPVQTVRASGTLITSSLSLGYDVPHDTVEKLLVQAAQASGLAEPFVHVQSLGDHAVTYQVAGLLAEVRSLLTTRSDLNRHILDVLHGNGIEIASPTIMNQRPTPTEYRFIPASPTGAPMGPVPGPEPVRAEDIAFDKAEQAGQREERLREVETQVTDLAKQLAAADESDKAALKIQLAALQAEHAEIAAESISEETA